MISQEQVENRIMAVRPKSIEILRRKGNTFDIRLVF